MDTIRHVKKSTLLTHCLRTSKILSDFDASPSLIRAALFHSIYGRKQANFKPLLDKNSSSDRSKLIEVIGTESENLVYLFCSLTDYEIYNLTSNNHDGIFNIKIQTDLINLDFSNILDHVIGVPKNSDQLYKYSVFLRFNNSLLPTAKKILYSLAEENL